MPELSILIPCLNEARNLAPLIKRLEDICVEADLETETIILDDASDDNTLEVAKTLQKSHKSIGIRIVHRFHPRRGIGTLIRYGMAHATGRYCLLVAADGTHPLEMLPEYVAHARKGAQLVQCSRYENPENNDNIPNRLKFYQAGFRFFVKLLLGWDIRDATSSFMLFDRILLLSTGIRARNGSVIPEIKFKVWLSGGKTLFIPGKQLFREKGISQFNFLRESASYGYVLFRAWLHRIGLRYWF